MTSKRTEIIQINLQNTETCKLQTDAKNVLSLSYTVTGLINFLSQNQKKMSIRKFSWHKQALLIGLRD